MQHLIPKWAFSASFYAVIRMFFTNYQMPGLGDLGPIDQRRHGSREDHRLAFVWKIFLNSPDIRDEKLNAVFHKKLIQEV
jgi:hypothetical protein